MSTAGIAGFRLAQAVALPAAVGGSVVPLAELLNAALGARVFTVLAGGVVAVGATGMVWNLKQLEQFHAAIERGDYSERDLRAFSQRIERSGGGFGGIIMKIDHPELDALLRPARQPEVPTVDELKRQFFGGLRLLPGAPTTTLPATAPTTRPPATDKPVDIAARASRSSMARVADSLGQYRDQLVDLRRRGLRLIQSGDDTDASTASVNVAVTALDKLVDRVERLATLDGFRAVFAAAPGLRRLVDASTTEAFTPATLASRTRTMRTEVQAATRQFGTAFRRAAQDVAAAERRATMPRAKDSALAVEKGPGEMIDPQRGQALGPNAGVGTGRDVAPPPQHSTLPRSLDRPNPGLTAFPGPGSSPPLGETPRHTGASRRESQPFPDDGTPRTTALGNGSLMRSEAFSNAAAEARWLKEGSDANLPPEVEAHIRTRYGLSAGEARQVMKEAVHEAAADSALLRKLLRSFTDDGMLNDTEMAQMQALDARLSPNDRSWVEPLIAGLVRKAGLLDTDREFNTWTALSDIVTRRGYVFVRGADDTARITRRPPSSLEKIDPYLADVAKRAGFADARVSVAVVEGDFDVQHSHLLLRTADDPRRGLSNYPPDFRWHSGAVSSIVTSNTLVTRVVPINVGRAGLKESVALLEAAIAAGARVVNLSIKPKSDADCDAWRAVAERHPNVIFTVAAGNAFPLQGATDERMAKLRGPPNVLIVANAENANALFADSQHGVGYATHVAIGTRVPIAQDRSGYGAMTGTSSAAPVVARVVAELFAADPRLSTAQILQILEITSKKSARLAEAADSGGLVNERSAVTLAALVGMRRRGIPIDASLEQLRLRGAASQWYLQATLSVLPYLPSGDTRGRTLDAMTARYSLNPTERDLLERVVSAPGGPAAQADPARSELHLMADRRVVASFLARFGLVDAVGVEGTLRAMFNRERVRANPASTTPP